MVARKFELVLVALLCLLIHQWLQLNRVDVAKESEHQKKKKKKKKQTKNTEYFQV